MLCVSVVRKISQLIIDVMSTETILLHFYVIIYFIFLVDGKFSFNVNIFMRDELEFMTTSERNFDSDISCS